MKKKSYEISSVGYAEFLYDIRRRKDERNGTITNVLLILGFLAFGWMSKDLAIFYIVNLAIGKIANRII